jgi:hypothetical protein
MQSTEHAFYSAEHASFRGTSIYEDLDGKEVHVTCIGLPGSEVVQEYRDEWKDTKHVGVVRKFIRNGQAGATGGTFDIGNF